MSRMDASGGQGVGKCLFVDTKRRLCFTPDDCHGRFVIQLNIDQPTYLLREQFALHIAVAIAPAVLLQDMEHRLLQPFQTIRRIAVL